MPATTDVIRGSLKLDNFQEGSTYADLDAFVKALADIFSVEIPEQITNVTVSSTEPGDDFKTGVWIRRNTAGNFVGLYLFQQGAWTKVFPEAVVIGETAAIGTDTGLWIETDSSGSYEKLWAYQSGTWLQLHPDPNPPDYAAIFATYYRSTIWGGVSASAVNQYFVTTVPSIDNLVVPTTISFIPDADNTGATTLDVNNLGAVTVIDSSGSPLSGGEFQQSVITEVTYDGVNWVVSLPAELNGINITPGTVDTDQLTDSAVTTAKIADLAVIASKIGIAAVSENRLAPNAVTTIKITDGAVTEPKLASDAISEIKILDGAVTTNKIGALAVTEAKIDVGAVTETKLGPLSVTGAKIANLTVTKGKLAGNCIDATKIEDDAVTADHLNTSVAGAGLTGGGGAALSINAGNGLELSGDSLQVNPGNGIEIASDEVRVDLYATNPGLVFTSGDLRVFADETTIERSASGIRVKAGSLTTSHLAANSVDSSELVNLSVDTGHIANNAVTLGKTNFAWSYIQPSVQYKDGTPLANIPERRDLRHMQTGGLLIICFEIEDTTPNYFSSGEDGLRLTGVAISGATIHQPAVGTAMFNYGAISPCWYDYIANTITIPYQNVSGYNFPGTTIYKCTGTLIVPIT